MSNTPRYPLPDLNSLPDDLKAKILEVQEKAGFVPNVFLALARRPAEWRAFFAYHDALMTPETAGRTSGLSKGEREMIVTTTSAANHCLYCVVAHGAILRIYEKKPLVADQVAVNHRKADIAPRQRAMLDFAMKVCLASHEIDDNDFAAVHAHGMLSAGFISTILGTKLPGPGCIYVSQDLKFNKRMRKLPVGQGADDSAAVVSAPQRARSRSWG